MSLALAWFYDPKNRTYLKTYWPKLKKWSLRIDNWAHSDTLSGIYGRLLEDYPDEIYPTLEKWNIAKNLWLRRLFIVSLIYYKSQRNKVLPLQKILSLLEPQPGKRKKKEKKLRHPFVKNFDASAKGWRTNTRILL
jgi:3-methyladenine DNA glycosylase AlkD